MQRALQNLTPTLILTRPKTQSDRFADALRTLGYDGKIIQSPLLDIRPTATKPNYEGIEGAIFTSRHGVELAPPAQLTAWCVGDRTAAAAAERGWKAISANGDAEALFRQICADAPKGEILHLRGQQSRGDLAHRLNAAGLRVKDVVLYDQVPMLLRAAAIEALSGDAPVIIPLFSPGTAAQFAKQGPFNAPLWIVSISRATAENVAELDVASHVKVPMPKADAMLDGIKTLIDAL